MIPLINLIYIGQVDQPTFVPARANLLSYNTCGLGRAAKTRGYRKDWADKLLLYGPVMGTQRVCSESGQVLHVWPAMKRLVVAVA